MERECFDKLPKRRGVISNREKRMRMEKSELYVRRYNKVRRAIKRAYRQLRRQGGWRAVGAQFGIHFSMANRIGVEGYMPTDREICKALGLPWSVELEVNPKTGRVVIPPELRRKRKVVVQVKHICGNCAWWEKNISGVSEYPVSEYICRGVIPGTAVSKILITKSFFGCNYWKRSMTSPQPSPLQEREEKKEGE
jgi:hypothetical protein